MRSILELATLTAMYLKQLKLNFSRSLKLQSYLVGMPVSTVFDEIFTRLLMISPTFKIALLLISSVSLKFSDFVQWGGISF